MHRPLQDRTLRRPEILLRRSKTLQLEGINSSYAVETLVQTIYEDLERSAEFRFGIVPKPRVGVEVVKYTSPTRLKIFSAELADHFAKRRTDRFVGFPTEPTLVSDYSLTPGPFVECDFPVGFVGRCQTETKKHETPDPIALKTIQPGRKYAWMFPGPEHALRANARFFVTPNAVQFAVVWDLEVFEMLLNLTPQNCSPIDWADLSVNPNSSCGPFYSLAFMDLRDYVLSGMPDIHLVEQLAHQAFIDQFWKTSGKTEILPAQKVVDRVSRTFLFQDAPYRLSMARWCQDFNQKGESAVSRWGSHIGFNRYCGGFSDLARKLNRFKYKVSADAKRWDANFGIFGAAVCGACRFLGFRHEYQNGDLYLRFIYQYSNMIWSIVVLPNGQVVLLPHGMPSGAATTADDNTLYHGYINLRIIKRWLERRQKAFTMENILKYTYVALYGDDNMGGYKHWDEEDTVMFKGTYFEHAILIPQESLVVSEDLVDHTFLGGRFLPHEIYGYIQGFDQERSDFSMCYSDGPIEPVSEWNKFASLYLLTFWNYPKGTHPYIKILQELSDKYAHNPEIRSQCGGMLVPTPSALEVLWQGNESLSAHISREGGK